MTRHQPDIAPCPGSGLPPAVRSPGRGWGECSWCHEWHGVWPGKGTVHKHGFKLSTTLDLLPDRFLESPGTSGGSGGAGGSSRDLPPGPAAHCDDQWHGGGLEITEQFDGSGGGSDG